MVVIMRKVRQVFVGVAKALLGAYVGAILYLLIMATQPAVRPPGARFASWSTVEDLFSFALAGVGSLMWWIVPIGAVFSLVLDPRIAAWPKSRAARRGALLGAILGTATAVAFFLLVWGTAFPARGIQIAFLFVPVYCAVWCAVFSKRRAAS
jgi:hypothetical protein